MASPSRILYSNSLPSNNMVANNSVAGQQAYGLMVYMPYPGDTFNQLIGNSVENIQGSVLGHDSGAGIYTVGAGAGGTTVANNTVRNCCVQTTVNRTMAPAGIGVAGISQVAAPVTVSGNTVSDVRPRRNSGRLVQGLRHALGQYPRRCP